MDRDYCSKDKVTTTNKQTGNQLTLLYLAFAVNSQTDGHADRHFNLVNKKICSHSTQKIRQSAIMNTKFLFRKCVCVRQIVCASVCLGVLVLDHFGRDSFSGRPFVNLLSC